VKFPIPKQKVDNSNQDCNCMEVEIGSMEGRATTMDK
jgi:hypothetical protein